MDNKNQNKEPSDQSFAQPQPAVFMVMPKDQMRGPLVGPKAPQVKQTTTDKTSNLNTSTPPLQSSSSGKKIAIILVVLFLLGILGAGGYFAYTKYFKTGNINTENTNPPAPPTEPPPVGVTVTTQADWQKRFFGSEACASDQVCGDSADPDRDGLPNKAEETLGTDPNNPDSDKDGLADGDEVNVFGGSPLNPKTAGNPLYTDADNAKGGYDAKNSGIKLTPERLKEISALLKQFGVHQPTLVTLGDSILQYQNVEAEGLPAGTDPSPEAQLDRDTQRLSTIQKFGLALYKYKAKLGIYPKTESFLDMTTQVKPYIGVATNASDPINKAPYVYSYKVNPDFKGFVMTYFSETQKQRINYTEVNATTDATNEGALKNDEQRKADLENIFQALLIYSSANAGGGQTQVFPPKESLESSLAPQYLQNLPKDPVTHAPYDYSTNATFSTFSLKAVLENPPAGFKIYACTPADCLLE